MRRIIGQLRVLRVRLLCYAAAETVGGNVSYTRISSLQEQGRVPPPLILYDGVCRLCTSTVLFVIKRDRHKRFRFASMQSPVGQRFLRQFGLAAGDFKTFVLVEAQGHFTRSTAALRVARQMDGLWPGLYVLIVIPKPIRDRVYDWVAKHRYRWFGRLEECLVPTKDVVDRFVDLG